MKRFWIIFFASCLLLASLLLWRSCSNFQQTGDTIKKRIRPDRLPRFDSTPDRMDQLSDLVNKGNVVIEFRGRVIDQSGIPLEDVEVKYGLEVGSLKNIQGWTSAFDRGVVTSGADGIFEIKGKKGSTISVGPLVKKGYRNGCDTERSFSYFGSPKSHDPSKIVDFLMVSENIARTKEIRGGRLSFAWNQGEVRIPLKADLGDFILIPSRDMRGKEKLSLGEQKDFDWSVKVSMDRAEIQKLPSDHSNIAPASGYQKMYEYGYSQGASKWGGAVQERYAFRTDQGKYGIIYFELNANGDDFSVNGGLTVRINESGARNLD